MGQGRVPVPSCAHLKDWLADSPPPPLLPCRARHRRIVAWDAQRHEDHKVRAMQIATGTLHIQTVISKWVLASFWVREDGCAIDIEEDQSDQGAHMYRVAQASLSLRWPAFHRRLKGRQHTAAV